MVEVNFTPWIPWAERGSLPKTAGVYRIAKAEAENVIYVGRTWGMSGLRDRVSAFNRSAITGLKAHAGGVTYNAKIGSTVDDLFVSVHVPLAVNPAEQFLRPYVDFVEKRIIWEIVQRTGALPTCNSDAGPRAATVA